MNLCLGYLAAVWLGCGPPGIGDGWEALNLPARTREPAGTEGESLQAVILQAWASAPTGEHRDDGNQSGHEPKIEPFGNDTAELLNIIS
jgi:hypothetical protein